MQLSPGSQTKSPQPPGHGPQSVGQVAQLSPARHAPSPHESQLAPQKVLARDTQPSSHILPQQNALNSQTTRTQSLHAGSSGPPARHGSWAHAPGQVPQSSGQLAQLSVLSQTMSPQRPPHGPQSEGQLMQFSVASQSRSPQRPGHGPQSVGQVAHPSPARHAPSPHKSHIVPQAMLAWFTQTSSHVEPQQNGSVSQTARTQSLHAASSGPPARHGSWAHAPGQVPQSSGQLAQLSVLSQSMSPQRPPHGPQSDGQPMQFSVASQSRSPQRPGHGPQSEGQLAQLSPAPQLMSPQRPGHGPQSDGQLAQFSVSPHAPSPQPPGHAPQSAGQVSQLSSGAQRVSPHAPGQSPQSSGQSAQVSPRSSLHAPSPQEKGQSPQSAGQPTQVSSPVHSLSPQRAGPASMLASRSPASGTAGASTRASAGSTISQTPEALHSNPAAHGIVLEQSTSA